MRCAVSRQIELKQLFTRGLLHVAVVDRVPASSVGTPPSSAREGFDRLYELVTPATVEAWATQHGGKR